MHELSIAMGIINIAENETKKANKKCVELIELEIGSLAGVELDSLHYVWKTAVKNTVLENAKLNIDYKQGKAKCFECKTIFDMNKTFDSCPKCKSHFKEILQGKELRVKSLEVI
jgi:hydrogenase nickel incorporation protein HypA/HybF